MKALYVVSTTVAVALAAATGKTVLGIRSGAAFGIELRKLSIGFDGVTAANVPVECQLWSCTFATNPPGTNSTSRTPSQLGGRVIASGMTGASNWTADPTVITYHKNWLLTPNGGLLIEEWPSGFGPDADVSTGFILRCVAPQIVNLHAYMEVERV